MIGCQAKTSTGLKAGLEIPGDASAEGRNQGGREGFVRGLLLKCNASRSSEGNAVNIA